MNRVIQHLHRSIFLFDADRLTDGQLLEAFLSSQDEAAFAALVRRHGRLVLGVCRRILGNAHDAEDAFQATFLVLVRKAGSLRSRDLLASWLYGVAYRTALKARALATRRQAIERRVKTMTRPAAAHDDAWQELRPLLDQELSRLPDKYRVPVVLCDLEGRGRKEVACLLGVPEGTLSSRLATARKRLARRLARHGVALTGGVLAALLTKNAASACVPAPLVAATMKAVLLCAAGKVAVVPVAVAALTGGVLKTMFLTKLKVVTVVVLGAAAVGLGTGRVIYQAHAGTGDSPAAEQKAHTNPVRASLLADGEKQKKQVEKQGHPANGKALRAKNPPAGGAALAGKASKDGSPLDAKNDLARLQEQEARVRKQYEESKMALLTKLKDLEAKQQKMLEEIKRQRDTLLQQQKAAKLEAARLEAAKLKEDAAKKEAARLKEDAAKKEAAKKEAARLKEDAAKNESAKPKQVAPRSPASADKLDRVLHQLEQMEKRLERLEQSRHK